MFVSCVHPVAVLNAVFRMICSFLMLVEDARTDHMEGHTPMQVSCGLDPYSTKLLMSHLSSIINIILRIVNLCFSSGDFPASCKSAIISPLIKKTRPRF